MESRDQVADGARLGEFLKSARLRRGLTLRELAEDSAVSATFLSRVERNDALPSDELVVKLAKRLGVDASAALLRLLRERVPPEARDLVPLPDMLRLHAGGMPGARMPGLEAIAAPMSQVLDLHRQVITENEELRRRNAELSDEVLRLNGAVAESNRQFLPDVNRFLTSLFNYETDSFHRDTVIARNGDAHISVTLSGVEPKPGANPIRNLMHSVFIPQALDGSLTISGGGASLEILEKPDDLPLEWTFRRETPERGAFLITFPEGFHGGSGGRKLSYRFSYKLEKTFVMTMEEAMANYGRHTRHEAPLEWSSCFINKPVRKLVVSVSFPEGYAPSYVDKWVWWTETSFLECDYNLADRLILEPEDGVELERGDRLKMSLRVTNPLLGFSYGIVWQPIPKRQFLSLIRGS